MRHEASGDRGFSYGGALVLGVLLAALATTPLVAGAESTSQDASPAICERSAEPLVEVYNENVDDVPGVVRNRVSDTTVHGVVRGGEGGDYTFVTDAQGRVETYSEGTPDDPTLRVITDCESFQAMADADDPVAAFWREYRANDVNFVGVGFVRAIVVDGVEIVVGFGDRIARATPLGFQEGVAVSGGLFLLALFAVFLVLTYVVYRRFTMLRRRRIRETAGADSGADGGDEGDGAGVATEDAPSEERE